MEQILEKILTKLDDLEKNVSSTNSELEEIKKTMVTKSEFHELKKTVDGIESRLELVYQQVVHNSELNFNES